MQINLILNFIWNSICSVKNIIHQVLRTFYLSINKLPILFSLAIIVVSAGLVFMVGLFIFFIVLYPGFIGTPLLFMEAPSLLAAACAGSWVGLFRFSWIASTLLYNPDNLLMTYLGTLYFYGVHYPQLVIFNFLLVSYNVYFFKYLKDLVYARLTGAERLNLSKDTKETLVGFIVVGILIIIIVCPPALGIGLSTSMDPYFESCSTYEQVHPSIALFICVGIVFSIAVLIKSIDLVILHKHEAGSLRKSYAKKKT